MTKKNELKEEELEKATGGNDPFITLSGSGMDVDMLDKAYAGGIYCGGTRPKAKELKIEDQ